ncbi:Cellular retinaldehyde binding/alpha-tocopherol transport,CRAL/TRIO, N-terminal domain,CRAL-TRIO lipid [Cinara cedri]|uniref:Cellular retinaldehyde binding/alpha-tocopherol transport,CRAL/TRIO, N-terminal domain,CRAL-TRIO lipid n=1 Tax=Cinara cedri TaxID=506608 RepID=A0A5E4MGS2_9HEMI|nr:Cellular retinaldehyde binding/alpha-tocopherol transport,CRAL/TRIO, N-terminal domain,CRAL-TRIO lipid [Cinara cedri]
MSPTKVSEMSAGYFSHGSQSEMTEDWCRPPEPCTLPKDVQLVALKELREDENIRTQSLLAFRQWISKSSDVQNINTEGRFLLRFLRTKKFSLPMAQQMLLKYLNLRQKYPMYFLNVDCLNPSVNEIIDSGYLFVSPFRDNHGRRVIIGTAKGFNVQKFNRKDLSSVHVLTYETLMNDEINQVMGYTHFGDFATVSPAHLTLFTPTEFATLVKWGEQSYPMRHKSAHLLNVPTPLKFGYDFFQSRLSSKIKNRMKIYNSLSELHEDLDKKVLPKEYGGEMPMAEMIALWKKELLANREAIFALDKMKLLSDKNIMTRSRREAQNRELVAGFNTLNGSFRKLEVD